MRELIVDGCLERINGQIVDLAQMRRVLQVFKWFGHLNFIFLLYCMLLVFFIVSFLVLWLVALRHYANNSQSIILWRVQFRIIHFQHDSKKKILLNLFIKIVFLTAWPFRFEYFFIYCDSLFIIQYNQMGLISKILLLIAFVIASQGAVTINQISGVSNDNLVFSGTIAISTSNSIFFTYYGVDGQKDQASLKNYPLFIFVGNPGISAQYYSLSGIGPVKLNNDMTLSPNANRFTNTANLMFIDLPGSGFSFTTNVSLLPTDAKTFGVQLTQAINSFIQESTLGQSSKLIIGGQGIFIRSLSGLDDIDTLKGIIHFSIWPEIYAIGRFYGIAGVQLKIYTESERIAIDSTFTSCYNYIRSSKFLEAHQCLDTIYNFAQSRTKNTNLFDVRLLSNLTEFIPLVQYYFSQPSHVAAWKAPNARLFESQSGYIANLTYVDLAKNYTKDISAFTKDYFSVRHWFIEGLSDYISYYKGVRNWIENELAFVESDAYKKAKLEDIVIDGNIVGYGKAVKQIAYSQILESGHHILHDQPKVLSTLFKNWVSSLTEEEANNIRTE